jgi:hypothetical protein
MDLNFVILNKIITTQNYHIKKILNQLNNNLSVDSRLIDILFSELKNDCQTKIHKSFIIITLIWLHQFQFISIDFENKIVKINQKFLDDTKDNNFLVNIFTIRLELMRNFEQNFDYNFSSFKNFDCFNFFFDFLKEYYLNVKIN